MTAAFTKRFLEFSVTRRFFVVNSDGVVAFENMDIDAVTLDPKVNWLSRNVRFAVCRWIC